MSSRSGRSANEEKWLAWLEGHTSLEHAISNRQPPTLERMSSLVSMLGAPQSAYPVIHITGTNGKGSVARMVSALLAAKGLSTGTYSSPDLQGVHERLAINGESIDPEALCELFSVLARVEQTMSGPASRFELLTAAAFRWFADEAVDVAVIEVGLGGTFDATNVADAAVAVVTNVGLDHTDLLGPTRLHIAKEKAGITKPGSTLILGEIDPSLREVFTGARAERIWLRGSDFDVENSEVALGGRLVSLRAPYGRYENVFLALHGGHQADNAAVALAATEAFFDAALPLEVVEEALASVTVAGRMEVVRRQPLVMLDGAHNVDGATALSEALTEEFGDKAQRLTVVIGLLEGRDPGAMLDALGTVQIRSLISCTPNSPRAINANVVASAARARGLNARSADSVRLALDAALGQVGDGGMVLVTGSLYVVGEARSILLESDGSTGPR